MKKRKWLSLILLPIFLLTLGAGSMTPNETGTRYLALTFDDGPRRETTERLLDGLAERNAKATFFVIGDQIEGNEDLIRRMDAEGHQIGNHTARHTNLQRSSAEQTVTEINKTEVALNSALGKSGNYWLRPPWGLIGRSQQRLIKTPMIHWSIDPEDWKTLNTAQVVEQVVRQAEDGAIVLLHDYYPSSVDAALQIIDILQKQGYQFVTVEELFAQEGVTAENGQIYKTPTSKGVLS